LPVYRCRRSWLPDRAVRHLGNLSSLSSCCGCGVY
jgi:hypothetical protein